jgi:phage gpG-like protein
MAAVRIKVNSDGAARALGQFAQSTSDGQRLQLLTTIGQGQLVSIYRTFDEGGSPAGSWPALAASTVKRMKGGASGHKLLIRSGRLRNSIRVQAAGNTVTIGTNLKYAPVQQLGSRDRGTGAGPQARIAGRDVKVGAHESHWMQRRGLRGVQIVDKNGVRRTVVKKEIGPLHRKKTSVRAHGRFQNIPGRPYLVFRPEDPARINEQVALFYVTQAKNAGLKVD